MSALRACRAVRPGTPVCRNFFSQEVHAAVEVLHSVHAIFYADPPIEALAFEFRKDGIVVVQPFSNLSMAETFGVTLGASFLLSQVLNRSFQQKAIAGMHRNNPVRNSSQQFQGIFSRKVSVAWVVIHSEGGMLHCVE